jgi:hypothetical protein
MLFVVHDALSFRDCSSAEKRMDIPVAVKNPKDQHVALLPDAIENHVFADREASERGTDILHAGGRCRDVWQADGSDQRSNR